MQWLLETLRQHRITPSSVPSGVPLCGLPFRESPASPVSPSGLRPFTLSPQSRHGSSYVPQRGVAAHRRSFRAGPGVAFGSSGRHAVACRSVHGKRSFPFRRSPVPGEGSGEKKNSLRVGEASNAWKSGPEIFQRLEKRRRNLPMFGRTAWRPFRSSEKGRRGGAAQPGVMRVTGLRFETRYRARRARASACSAADREAGQSSGAACSAVPACVV